MLFMQYKIAELKYSLRIKKNHSLQDNSLIFYNQIQIIHITFTFFPLKKVFHEMENIVKIKS
jgi:hypothetical protein